MIRTPIRYQIIFDLAQTGFQHWFSLAGGFIFIAFALVLFWLARRGARTGGRRAKLQLVPITIFLAVCSVLPFVWFAILLPTSIKKLPNTIFQNIIMVPPAQGTPNSAQDATQAKDSSRSSSAASTLWPTTCRKPTGSTAQPVTITQALISQATPFHRSSAPTPRFT